MDDCITYKEELSVISLDVALMLLIILFMANIMFKVYRGSVSTFVFTLAISSVLILCHIMLDSYCNMDADGISEYLQIITNTLIPTMFMMVGLAIHKIKKIKV